MGTPVTELVQLRLDKKVYAALRKRAEDDKRSIAGYVRALIARDLEASHG